jgi:hypothetical protein
MADKDDGDDEDNEHDNEDDGEDDDDDDDGDDGDSDCVDDDNRPRLIEMSLLRLLIRFAIWILVTLGC